MLVSPMLRHLHQCVLVFALAVVGLGAAECALATAADVHAAAVLADHAGSAGSDAVCSSKTDCYSSNQQDYILLTLSAIANALHIDGWRTGGEFCAFLHVTCRPAGVEFDLSNLRLSGSFPPDSPLIQSVISQVMITKMVFDGNSGITGTLPPYWGDLALLKSFSAAATNMSGTLPTEWAGLAGLETLLLNDTMLSGEIPESWGALAQLRTVSVAGSNVTGCLPTQWLCNANLTLEDVGLPLSASCPSKEHACATQPPDTSTSPRAQSLTWWAVLLIAVGAFVLLAVVVLAVVCAVRHHRRRRRRQAMEMWSDSSSETRATETTTEGTTDDASTGGSAKTGSTHQRTLQSRRSFSTGGELPLAHEGGRDGWRGSQAPPDTSAPPTIHSFGSAGYSFMRRHVDNADGAGERAANPLSRENAQHNASAFSLLGLRGPRGTSLCGSFAEPPESPHGHSAVDRAQGVGGNGVDASRTRAPVRPLSEVAAARAKRHAKRSEEPPPRPLTEAERRRLARLMSKDTCLVEYGPFIEMDDTGITDSPDCDAAPLDNPGAQRASRRWFPWRK